MFICIVIKTQEPRKKRSYVVHKF